MISFFPPLLVSFFYMLVLFFLVFSQYFCRFLRYSFGSDYVEVNNKVSAFNNSVPPDSPSIESLLIATLSSGAYL